MEVRVKIYTHRVDNPYFELNARSRTSIGGRIPQNKLDWPHKKPAPPPRPPRFQHLTKPQRRKGHKLLKGRS